MGLRSREGGADPVSSLGGPDGPVRFRLDDVEHWLDQLRIDPDNEFIGTLLSRLQLVHTKELKEMSALGAGYAAVFLVEGTGLLFRKRWAEWLTIVVTSSLMPFEVYELIKQFTIVRLLVMLVNAAVVLFLIYRVRQKEN